MQHTTFISNAVCCIYQCLRHYSSFILTENNCFIYYLYTSFKIPGEQDTEAVKPGKKTLETVKGVSLIKPLSGYNSK